jgi:hypothetical protein
VNGGADERLRYSVGRGSRTSQLIREGTNRVPLIGLRHRCARRAGTNVCYLTGRFVLVLFLESGQAAVGLMPRAKSGLARSLAMPTQEPHKANSSAILLRSLGSLALPALASPHHSTRELLERPRPESQQLNASTTDARMQHR